MRVPDLADFWNELVACNGDQSRLLDLISARAAAVIGEAAALTVVSADGEHLELAAAHHPSPTVRAQMETVLQAAPYRIGTGVAGVAAQRRKPVVHADLTSGDASAVVAPAWRPFLDGQDVHAIMAMPLIAYGELVGTLTVFRLRSLDPYTADDLRVLEALGERAALALADAGPRRSALSADDLRAIFEHSMDGVLFTVPDGRVLAANPAACRILDMSETEICRRGRAGLLPPDDPQVDAAVARRALAGSARAEIPMLRRDGSAFIADVSSTVFSATDGQLRSCVIFRDVTDQVSLRHRLEERGTELERLAELDEMTGLLNRRGFDAAARRTFAFADRDGARVQLLFCDIDRLKEVNDRHGHDAGDRLIREFTTAVSSSLREVDCAARLGGDEFVVLLYGAGGDDANVVVERVARSFATISNNPAASFSAGRVERAPGDRSSLEALLAAADRKMYVEKHRHGVDRRT
jgi:diguanylate cyclase (GGDEF)-like protein/PAS domain S-box-containing protein